MTIHTLNIQTFRTVVMAIMLALAALVAAPASAAETGISPQEAAAKPYAGRILLDTGRNGEAWYVNPQTLQRTYLGRPIAALERLSSRSVPVAFLNIERLAETVGADHDAEYGIAVAGHVLAPSDLIGAPWYVHPDTHVRMRLATPEDAWKVLQTGTPVSSRVISAIAEEVAAPARFTTAPSAPVVEDAGTIVFGNGTTVKLLGAETPANPELQEAATALLSARLAAAKTVLLERDKKAEAPSGMPQRYVLAGEVNLSLDLVRNGLAFPAIDFPNFRYAEQLIVASLDAQRQQRGFWDPAYQQTHVLATVVY
jgi:endonuclease YncB( thermonuclease family)